MNKEEIRTILEGMLEDVIGLEVEDVDELEEIAIINETTIAGYPTYVVDVPIKSFLGNYVNLSIRYVVIKAMEDIRISGNCFTVAEMLGNTVPILDFLDSISSLDVDAGTHMYKEMFPECLPENNPGDIGERFMSAFLGVMSPSALMYLGKNPYNEEKIETILRRLSEKQANSLVFLATETYLEKENIEATYPLVLDYIEQFDNMFLVIRSDAFDDQDTEEKMLQMVNKRGLNSGMFEQGFYFGYKVDDSLGK